MKRDWERESEIMILHAGEVSMTEIGAQYGISRARVGQIIARNTGRSRNRNVRLVDPVRVVSALRDSDTMSIADLATATGFTGRTCSVCLRALGLLDAACRLLRWRRRSREKARIVAALRKAAESLGRTPKVHEGGGSPAQGSAVAAFGSWRNAVVAAGLIPRDRGKTTCLNQAAA